MLEHQVRVLITDDNKLARVGIAALLATDPAIDVVATATDGAEGLRAYDTHHPDVVLVDLKMPRVDGVQMVAALMRADPPGKALVLTQYEGDDSVFRALKAGALGYVTKEIDGDELLAAIRVVARGDRYIPAAIAAKLADRMARPALSLREIEVLKLIYAGDSNREIAARLSVAERTVAAHVGSILGKLEAKSRTEAISTAIKRGILHPD